MTPIEMLSKFVNSLKGCDEEAGLDLLREFESQASDQAKELDFSLAIFARFFHLMMSHQESLREAEQSLNRAFVPECPLQ